MKKYLAAIAFLLTFSFPQFAQEVGTSADSPSAGHIALKFSSYSFRRHLTFVSEFSFFTESSWAIGLRWSL